MVPGNLQRHSSTCLLQRNFEKVVVAQQGFVWKNERPGVQGPANEKWGWISDMPGSWVELEVDTTTELEASAICKYYFQLLFASAICWARHFAVPTLGS